MFFVKYDTTAHSINALPRWRKIQRFDQITVLRSICASRDGKNLL
jgi:hypothetical protein